VSPARRVPLDLRGLERREDIFRVSAAATAARSAAVEAWFEAEPLELRHLARAWFMRMRACGAEVRELLHDGCPVACVEDAPFGYVNAFRSHVNVGFFNGAALADPAQLLQGSGKRMRHVKLTPGEAAATAALAALIVAAHRDIHARLEAERAARLA
jgi:hypothetical protein